MSTSLPRPALIALIGVVALAGVFFLTRRGGGESTNTAPPAPTQTGNPPAATSQGTATATAPSATQTRAPSGGGRAAGATTARTLPSRVKRALDAHKVVVLLFWTPRGIDDRSVKNAVDRLPRRGGDVAVFTDRTRNLARYTRITSAASIVQTPTLVVVNKQGQARRATGYLDPTTVEQYVVDALHGAP